MGQEIEIKNGIVPLLTKSLPPHELDKHRANVCVVMETMVRKHDKFGWDQMNAGMRQMIREDWLAALSDYPVGEVRGACRLHTQEAPNKVPNEGHIKAIIVRERGKALAAAPRLATASKPLNKPTAEERKRSADYAARAGFSGPKRFTDTPKENTQ